MAEGIPDQLCQLLTDPVVEVCSDVTIAFVALTRIDAGLVVCLVVCVSMAIAVRSDCLVGFVCL